jgi:hypothetical protein
MNRAVALDFANSRPYCSCMFNNAGKGGDPMSSDMCSVSADFGSVGEVLG